ncbi:MAG: ATP-binding cassette domain-containing protein, partial [Clostridiales bacterium]|nr:ATP-binding cassette domain-containing protein [Clostridiales bacterium]
ISAISEGRRDRIRRRSMGFVFQSVALISLMSAYENVEFALRVAGVRKGRRRRAESCLNFVGLRNRMHHRPGELSGGEQQRVAIARAIAHRPSLIFADEPTAELDTHMALQVMKLFRDLVNEERATVIMTTHDPNMMELADKVYTLEDGQVVEVIDNDLSANGNGGEPAQSEPDAAEQPEPPEQPAPAKQGEVSEGRNRVTALLKKVKVIFTRVQRPRKRERRVAQSAVSGGGNRVAALLRKVKGIFARKSARKGEPDDTV